MTALHKNRVQMSVASVGADPYTITLDAASSGYQSFATAYGADATVDILITMGTTWEVARGCTYTHVGTTVTRGTFEDSSTGSRITTFDNTAVVSVIFSAGKGVSVEGALQAVTPGGRLTLESGVPVTTAANAVAVSGQDTGADTITVTAHGWSVGTMVKSTATSGGITAGTQYYAGNITTNTISLHTTVAAALAGTSKLDITGTVTATIIPSGVSNTSVYYTPYVHNIVNLWDGSNWTPIEFTETTLALGTLTDATPYDVFGYLSAGALVLESLAWTDDTARATEITWQDGRYCKSGDKTRLYLGTFYTTSTTTTESSTSNRYIFNMYNRVSMKFLSNGSTSHTYVTTTYREFNAGTGVSRFNAIVGVNNQALVVGSYIRIGRPTAGLAGYMAPSLNSTTATPSFPIVVYTATADYRAGASQALDPILGFNYLTCVEYGNADVTYYSFIFTGGWLC